MRFECVDMFSSGLWEANVIRVGDVTGTFDNPVTTQFFANGFVSVQYNGSFHSPSSSGRSVGGIVYDRSGSSSLGLVIVEIECHPIIPLRALLDDILPDGEPGFVLTYTFTPGTVIEG
jgi:hypothetical protein